MGVEHATGVGARIRACRLARGLSASALGVRAGVTENAIRKIESGDSKEPRFSTGLRIAAALGVDANDLLEQTAAVSRQGPELATVLRRLRQRRDELRGYGIAHAAVFGSVARGEATQSSDVDILIEPAPDERLTLIDISTVQSMLEEALEADVDVVTAQMLRRSETGRAAEQESVRAF